MEESVLHIKLMNQPILRVCHRDDCANSGRLNNRAEGFIVVNSGALSESLKYPTSLVSLQ